jgi:hypothetical protein
MSQGYEEYGDEREYADEEYEEAGDLDEAGMDTGFYNQVDGFLSRPSPAVLAGMSSGKGGGKSGSKKTKVGLGKSSAGVASGKKGAGNGQNPSSSSCVRASDDRAAAAAAPSSSQQPQLAGGGGGGRKPKNTAKSRLNLGLKPKPSSRPLDKELLEEAFMYVYVQ